MQDTEKEQPQKNSIMNGRLWQTWRIDHSENNAYCIYMYRQNVAETSVILLTPGDEGPIGETMNKYLVDA